MPKVSQRFSEAKKGSAETELASGLPLNPMVSAAIAADGLHPRPKRQSAMTPIATPSSMIGGLRRDEVVALLQGKVSVTLKVNEVPTENAGWFRAI